MLPEWEHACRLFNCGLLEESRQVIHRLRANHNIVFSNQFYQYCCARCSLILFPSVTCAVSVRPWNEIRKDLSKKRRQSGLYVARFKDTILISTVCQDDKPSKRLQKDDHLVIYKCANCGFDLIYDNMPFKQADASPILQKKEATIATVEGKKKATIKQIMSGKPATASKSSGLDLGAFLKRL